MSRTWSTPDDIAAKVRRRWDDGSLLRAHADRKPFEPIEVPLRGPTASEIGADVGAAREWVTALDAGRRDDRRYTLQWQSVGGRHVGRNQLPARAVVSSFEQAWALLGVAATVRRFDELLELAHSHRAVRSWLLRYPLRALELATDMPRLVAAYAWLDDQRDSGRYLREISAPGVDTKFAERHRTVLAAMLEVSSTSSGFLSGLGLQGKPEFVRLRPAATLGLPSPLTELTARADEVARLDLRPRSVLVIENEITYLSVDVPEDGMVLWGKGFEVDRIGRLPWLADVPILYWGDLDTHGFAILDRLRAWLPQTESVLMDRETLMSHRDRWVTEQRPASSDLTHLTHSEHDLYTDLVSDALGERVRLEQERIDWSWVRQRLELT
ncbi:Wadjet anti-phage system protein JetD domain-containing protein [Gordonia sp. Z-3]|uniref:Wadjet anti-phage system protein JetD domain-containing protein n=1 Tax=Gordonia sp. Z-3 TaxID=3115408 RepID=UPI002E2CD54B|nr:Wadjet anti-phage system protein JetD domain-containing protein [Gordonia sp. Z-3]MED5803349.1 Wadjet anti-phage system protein JetD domain-containing protein [Gordonia sp. Z-3]